MPIIPLVAGAALLGFAGGAFTASSLTKYAVLGGAGYLIYQNLR